MARLLLLLPTSTYRAGDFLQAARALGAEVVVASERRQALAGVMGHRALTVSCRNPDQAADRIVRLAAGKTVPAALRAARANPFVAYAEPNYVLHVATTPNDPKYADGTFVKGPNQSVTGWDNPTAGTDFEQMLTSTPNIGGVLVANDGMAQSVIAILKNERRKSEGPVRSI